MANLNSQQIIESLISTMQSVSQSVVDSNDSNSTIRCTIVAITDKGYKVNYNSVQFEVFTLSYDNTEYKLGDIVYVSVPNGDFSQTKYIIHKDFMEEDISTDFDPEEDLYPGSKIGLTNGESISSPIEKLVFVYETADCREKKELISYPEDFGLDITLMNMLQPQRTIQVRPKDMAGMIYYNPHYTQNKFGIDVTSFQHLQQEVKVKNSSNPEIKVRLKKILGGLSKSLHKARNSVDIYSYGEKTYVSFNKQRTVEARFFYTTEDGEPLVTYDYSDIKDKYVLEWYRYSESTEEVSPQYIPKNWYRIAGDSFIMSISCSLEAEKDGLLCCVRTRELDDSGQPLQVFYDYVNYTYKEVDIPDSISSIQTEIPEYEGGGE